MAETRLPPSISVTKRLTVLYLAALGSIALLTTIGQFVVQKAIFQLEGDSRIVNIAGRQRMLSQRLTRLVFELSYAREASMDNAEATKSLASKLQTDLATWTQNHNGLQHGSDALNLPGKNSAAVANLFRELGPHFEALRDSIESEKARVSQGVQGDVTATQNNIGFHSDAFLAGMDQIVTHLEQEARDRVNRLQRIESALLIATIAVLVCEGLFVFSPAVAWLNRSLKQLQSTSNELANAKEFAENANRAKTDFLARVSHELRTPLHAILGMLGLVERTELKPGLRTKIRLAHDASKSLLSLVDDLLDVASIEAGSEFPIHQQTVHLVQLLTSTAEVMRPLAISKGLQFELNLDESLPAWIIIDADRLRQVAMNLLQNAIRYTITGAVRCKADLAFDATQKHLLLTIEDTGIGISPFDQQQIFNSFSRGDSPQSPSEFGRRIGLGLTISQAIVKQLGGTICLSSEVGKGSCFTVSLPIQMANADHTINLSTSTRSDFSLQQRTKLPAKILTAMLVDDSPTNLLVMRSYLKELGFRTMSVSSLNESIRRFQKHSFDIVLMDRNLVDGDGLDFPNRVSSSPLFTSTRIFLLTAEINLKESSDPRLRTFTRVLHKPISLAELQNAIAADLATDISVDREYEAPQRFERLKSKLASRVIGSLPDDIASLRTMLGKEDFAGLAFLSHRLMGSAGNAGLTEIASLARNLSEAALQSDAICCERSLSQMLNLHRCDDSQTTPHSTESEPL